MHRLFYDLHIKLHGLLEELGEDVPTFFFTSVNIVHKQTLFIFVSLSNIFSYHQQGVLTVCVVFSSGTNFTKTKRFIKCYRWTITHSHF